MKTWIPILLLASMQAAAQDSRETVLKELVQKEQRLADAIAVGDKAVWNSTLDDSCIMAIEDGSIVTKEKQVAELNPLPPAFKGMITITEPTLTLRGNTALLTFISDEQLELYGQKIHTQYRQSDTWMKVDGEWKIVGMHLFEIPKNPPPADMPGEVLAQYAGTYKLGDDRKCKITADSGKLYAQKNDKAPVELFAETENVFFRKGDGRVRVIFIKNSADGKYRMIERRAGEDVVWTKIQ